MSERNEQLEDDTHGAKLANKEQPSKNATVTREKQQAMGMPAPAGDQAEPDKHDRQGIMRDGFSMPEADYRLIAEIRTSCVQLGVLPTKSGILRAGLHALSRMDPQDLGQLIKSLEPVKTGRPAKKS